MVTSVRKVGDPGPGCLSGRKIFCLERGLGTPSKGNRALGGRIKARESGGGFGIRNRCLFTDARKRTVVESKAFRI